MFRSRGTTRIGSTPGHHRRHRGPRANNLDGPDFDDVVISDPQKWIEESFEIAKASVYKHPIGANNGPFAVTKAYKKAARTIAEERIALAGARLAKLLNDSLR
jgi:S1/P1 Nuclease